MPRWPKLAHRTALEMTSWLSLSPNNDKRVRTVGVWVFFPFKSKVHLYATSPYVLSKYHIIQFAGIELIAKYPLGSQEMPPINCLVREPLGYHQGSTLNA